MTRSVGGAEGLEIGTGNGVSGAKARLSSEISSDSDRQQLRVRLETEVAARRQNKWTYLLTPTLDGMGIIRRRCHGFTRRRGDVEEGRGLRGQGSE